MRFIFFDIDGTLILTDGAGKRALGETLKSLFQVKNPNVDIDYGGRTDLSICKEIFQLNKVKFDGESYQDFISSYVNKLEAELAKSRGKILPGVLDLLEILNKDERYHLGLITGNIQKGAFKKLGSHGLDSFFQFGGFGDRQEHRNDIAIEGKSDAERFAKKALDPKQMLVIGDTPHDITCSRAIGASCLAVLTGYATEEAIRQESPEFLLRDLKDTDEVLSIFDQYFL